MRHSNSGKKLSRTPAHRKALLHNLAKALLIHGRIRTTEVKAKELRGVVEPLISLAIIEPTRQPEAKTEAPAKAESAE